MNRMRAILTLALVFFGATMSVPALAGHGGGGHGGGGWHGGGHVHVGVVVGGGGWWGPWGYPYYGYSPYYYGYPPYYYPPVAAPAQYVEQAGAVSQEAPAQQGSWYYCAESKTYYPYVKECPGGWQRVAPQPPGG